MRKTSRLWQLFGVLALFAFPSFATPINTLGRATSRGAINIKNTTGPNFKDEKSDSMFGNIDMGGTFHGLPKPPKIYTEFFSQYKVKTEGSIIPSVSADVDMMITYGSMIGGGKAEAMSALKYSVMLVPYELPNVPKFGVTHITATLSAYANSAFVVDGPGSVRAEAALKIPDAFIDRFGDPYIAEASGLRTDDKSHENALYMNYYYLNLIPMQAYEIIITAKASVEGSGGSGHARAFVDPMFELDPVSKPYFQLLYSPNLIGTTPDVPEPGTWTLMACSLAGLLVYGRKHRRA